MSGGGDEGQCKWPCGLCTYLNYSNSGRCTMCGNVRPQNYIIPTTSAENSSSSNVIVTTPPTPPSLPLISGEYLQCSYIDLIVLNFCKF